MGSMAQKLSSTNAEGLEHERGSDPILALKTKALKIKESLDIVGTWKDH